MKNKKALFLDMDATTLNDEGVLPEENREAIRRCIQAGHQVVINTGRTPSSAEYLRTHYGLGELGCRYMINCNGGAIMDCEKAELLFERTLPLEQVCRLVDAAREEELYIQTYQDGKVLSERGDDNLKYYARRTQMDVIVVPDIKKALREEPCKMLAIDLQNEEKLHAFIRKMAEWSRDKVDMYFSNRSYLEIVPKGVNKGFGMLRFCELLDIPLENTVAAGDENNDIPMLKAAKIGCAVANAMESVKAAADYVTERDNNHCAVAEIIEKFIL